MPTRDYYEVLGVARDASGDAIKRAYRALAREHHPDVAHDKSKAEHRFKEINEAYEVLSDPKKRAQYDHFGYVGNGAAGTTDFGFGQGSFGDIFDMFFGNVRGTAQHRRAGPERGSDLRYDVEITLEEAFHGATKEIVFDRLAQCETCKGSGAKAGTMIVPCEAVRRQRNRANGAANAARPDGHANRVHALRRRRACNSASVRIVRRPRAKRKRVAADRQRAGRCR